MIESEVLIVGGRLAVSSYAWRLEQSDVECIILDKKEFPKYILCRRMVSTGVTKKLNIDIKKYPAVTPWRGWESPRFLSDYT